MSDRVDIVELAREIAKIASATTDSETAQLLLVVVERLLRAAGLPSGDDRSPH
jgi:hypothetical protein